MIKNPVTRQIPLQPQKYYQTPKSNINHNIHPIPPHDRLLVEAAVVWAFSVDLCGPTGMSYAASTTEQYIQDQKYVHCMTKEKEHINDQVLIQMKSNKSTSNQIKQNGQGENKQKPTYDKATSPQADTDL
jgi:hypothetical protein